MKNNFKKSILIQDYFVEQLELTSNTTMLDMAGGTGDIAFRAIKKIQQGFLLKELGI